MSFKSYTVHAPKDQDVFEWLIRNYGPQYNRGIPMWEVKEYSNWCMFYFYKREIEIAFILTWL